MFPNFPTIRAAAVPSTPPPLAMGMKPKVPTIRGQNEDDYDSSAMLFDTKANNPLCVSVCDDNNKPLTHTPIYE